MSASRAVFNACRLTDRLFVVNPYLPHQNFSSLQLRALALASEIGSGLSPGRRNICVIGGGVAGRTVAAGLLAVGANVSIVDKNRTPFSLYLKAAHRELHPNAIFWPAELPSPTTCLPFLNWGQAPTPKVVENLTAEWDAGFGKKIPINLGTVTDIQEKGGLVQIKLKDGNSISTQICVIATGFTSEISLMSRKTPSYWSLQSVTDSDEEYIVSGSGDGGIIDSVSPFLGLNVTKVAHILAAKLSGTSICEDITQAEEKRIDASIDSGRDSLDPCNFYSTIYLEPAIQKAFDRFLDADHEPKIKLIHETTSAYSSAAAPINKLLLSHFTNNSRRIELIKGRIEERGDKILLVRDVGPPEEIMPSTKLIVRHGARPAIELFLNPLWIDGLRKAADTFRDAAKVRTYDQTVFKWHLNGIGRAEIELSSISDSIRKAIYDASGAFGIRLSNFSIGKKELITAAEVTVDFDTMKDELAAAELQFLPLRVGQVKVVKRPENPFVRGIKYDD